MVKQFFCKIDSAIDNGYKVILNSSNINLLPDKDLTIRRIFTDIVFKSGDLLYVDSAELKEGGKLHVVSAYIMSRPLLNPISSVNNISIKPITDTIKQSIVDCDIHPIEIFQQLCGTNL